MLAHIHAHIPHMHGHIHIWAHIHTPDIDPKNSLYMQDVCKFSLNASFKL